MIEHHIQKDILLRLSKADSLRFSELKPHDMESNTFMYHLKQLSAQKMVQKTDTGYSLSEEGLAYIDGFSYNTLQPRKQPKLITILALQNANGDWLLAQRKRQPYRGQYMLPSGKQHLGESPQDHAERESRELLGVAVPLVRRGMTDIRIRKSSTLITHVTAHVYAGKTSDMTLPAETDRFRFQWMGSDDRTVQLLAGTQEIIDALEHETSLFFLSLDATDD